MRAARIALGITQKELAGRMHAARSVLSRAETGESFPSVDFIERYAHALGLRILLSFGPECPVEGETMLWRAWRGFHGIVYRHDRFSPLDADAILRTRIDEDPGDLYLEMLTRARHLSGRDWRYRDIGDPDEVRGPTALAAMYWESVDWVAVRGSIQPPLRRLDAKIRKRAWQIVTDHRPIPLWVTSGEWIAKGARDAWTEGVKAIARHTR